MKGKIISAAVNAVLCLTIACVCLVGFVGGRAEQVTSDGENVFYRSEAAKGVSLMFNVYENTQNVYSILDALDEGGAKATFFLGGCWADDNADCVREIYSRGHELASHGYFHKDHSKLSYEQNLAEIRPSVKLITALTGSAVYLFAPPSGAFCDATVTAAAELGLKTIMWSRDTIDWRDSDGDKIFTRATQNLQKGEFVLMHPEDVTVSTLPKILDYLKQNSLPAVTVSDNLGK